ncbi:tyrosine-protein phosphatase [Novosphingobium sp. Gsoil 351]|uniref:tyrosine-protein phosphatase n=1 Tax=Novosphingobium sp. Gsoil 351 TaxID=2675225 RepID=UPI0012B4C2B2|nr:tyrosine-protein phosphatase [Novosphingobium sp. Gsoil 351]QGN56202.1 protein-tyrosine-phosphatase [Novosphingobium sp. Gsoil 351]
MDQDRILPLEGIRNFRDYGGYAAADGASVSRGVLWRSGHHHQATPADLAKVAALGLDAVIDLRGDSERSAFPCLRHPEFTTEVLFAPGETAGLAGAAAHEAAGEGVRTGGESRAAMVNLNRGMPWRPVLVASMRLYFAALAEGRKPILLHCVAGKDRTGLAAWLTHHALGVHPDDAMADYLLTNVATNLSERMALGAETVRARYGPRMDDEAVLALMSVAPEYISAGLDAIRERHGTYDGYLEEVLGVGPAQVAAIQADLLV